MVMLPIMRYRQPHLWKKKRTIVNKQKKKGRKKITYENMFGIFKTDSNYVAQPDLELAILLFLTPRCCWDFRDSLPSPA